MHIFKKLICMGMALCMLGLPCASAHEEIASVGELKFFTPNYQSIRSRIKVEPIELHPVSFEAKYIEEKIEEIKEIVEEPTEPEIVIDPEDRELLACVIYQEAGGNECCDDCRRRVADVVLNRVESDRFPYADTIHEVLTAKRQYGRFYWTGVVWPERASNPNEKEAVERAYRIAEEVLSGQHSELYGQGYVWQAEFKQGKDIIECCGTYFGR